MFVLQSNVFLLLYPIGGNDKMFSLSIKMKWKESVFPSRRFRIVSSSYLMNGSDPLSIQ